jgi:hypothetical protein
MATEARIETALNELNAAMGDVTPYKLALVDPADMEHVDKNARYMAPQMMRQLSDNIAKDGNLASLPFCWRKPDGTYVVLSGNHRRDAAVAAEVPAVLVLYTDDDLTNSQARSIQLSHNALSGQDNPAVLRELWEEIDDIQYRIYSGLDEEFLETLEPVNIIAIGDQALRFEELVLLFIPPEIGRIEEVVERLGENGKVRLAVDLQLWDSFWDKFLEFKESSNVLNSSTAFALLTEIADEWLSEHNGHEHEPQD